MRSCTSVDLRSISRSVPCETANGKSSGLVLIPRRANEEHRSVGQGSVMVHRCPSDPEREAEAPPEVLVGAARTGHEQLSS
mmetsp:Transcript_56381/g.150815  ORF Transcript_56381/g.150815 Transcript_56381/m.150815 type:complete len:81 (+) Transcript_56381:366-608(+)